MGAKRRIGIYGGTFSPPHLGHKRACEAFLKTLQLDELLIIPAFTPPHKDIDGGADASARVDMCSIAFGGISGIKISDMEIKRGGKSYTVDTLSELKCDDNELYFLMGTDMFLTFDRWYKPNVIASLATICLARRENDSETELLIEQKLSEYKTLFDIRVEFIDYTPLELSSTRVRDMIRDGEPLNGVLDKGVIDYIRKEGLYLD